MAWKVIGAFSGDVGPMPIKRWTGPSYDKRHKMNYKPRRKIPKQRAGDRAEKEASYKAKAIEYCRWLAKRDGIALPPGIGVTVWNGDYISAVTFLHPKLERLYVTIRIPNFDWEPAEPAEEIIRPGDALVDWVQYALAA